MSKGLEALERLYCAGRLDLCYVQSEKHKKDYELIEKELKALEIIKSKEMLSVFKDIYGKCFIVFNTTAIEIPQEEYDLLKEVLL